MFPITILHGTDYMPTPSERHNRRKYDDCPT